MSLTPADPTPADPSAPPQPGISHPAAAAQADADTAPPPVSAATPPEPHDAAFPRGLIFTSGSALRLPPASSSPARERHSLARDGPPHHNGRRRTPSNRLPRLMRRRTPARRRGTSSEATCGCLRSLGRSSSPGVTAVLKPLQTLTRPPSSQRASTRSGRHRAQSASRQRHKAAPHQTGGSGRSLAPATHLQTAGGPSGRSSCWKTSHALGSRRMETVSASKVAVCG